MMVLTGRTLFGVALLCAALGASPVFAQASSSGSVNGISYTVVGGSNQSISGAGAGLEVVTDGVNILVLPDQITVDGNSYAVEAFTEVVIDRSNGGLLISVDGRDVVPAETSSLDETKVLPVARFFYADGDTPVGPMTLDQLRALIGDGTVTPQTLAWEGGTDSWIAIHDLPALNE